MGIVIRLLINVLNSIVSRRFATARSESDFEVDTGINIANQALNDHASAVITMNAQLEFSVLSGARSAWTPLLRHPFPSLCVTSAPTAR